MIRFPFSLAILLCAGSLCAQDLRMVTEPSLPQPCTVLTAQLTSTAPNGLDPASESLLDTPRIQAALNGCTPGQAVKLSTGAGGANAFLTGALKLPKGITLLIDTGVTLYASRNPRDFDADQTKSCGTITAAGTGCLPILTATSADGSGIMGYGTIDGRGHLPMLAGANAGTSWWDLARAAQAGGNQNNPRMLVLTKTNGFTLYKVTLKNSPMFHVSMDACQNVTFWGIKIIAPFDARNTDGIDPGYSSNVSIVNSYISEGDDNVAVGGSTSPGASNITVLNNHFGDGHGASIGSYTQAGVSNVLFSNITFSGDAANSNQAGLHIKSDISRGGVVQNITYANVCMKNVRDPILLDPFYTAGAKGTLVPQFVNITAQNIHAVTEGRIQIAGHDASVPASIVLNNFVVDGVKQSDVTTSFSTYTLGPGPVNFAGFLQGTGVNVTNGIATQAAPLACPADAFSPVAGELIPGTLTTAVNVQIFPYKEIPLATYETNLKTNPAATLDLTAPGGTVSVYDGATSIATAPVTHAGLMTIPVSGLTDGVHTIEAIYSGDGTYAPLRLGSYSLTVGAPIAGTPVIAGITNAASFTPGTAPYGIAQGSYFAIFGDSLGPVSGLKVAALPIPTTLANTRVVITSGGQTFAAYLVYVSKTQINAILPSTVPLGIARLTVIAGGVTSAPVPFNVTATQVGLFSYLNSAIAQNVNSPTDYPLNGPATPAKPGQIMLLWATGMGALGGPDDVAPGTNAADMVNVPVSILVGGLPAQRLYAGRQSEAAGVDVIYFTVPAGVTSGCQVPVQIVAGGQPANAATIAITADGSSCK